MTYAVQKYGFDLYRGGPLKPISEAQWQSGTPINAIEYEEVPAELEQKNYWGLVVGFDQSGDQSTGKGPVLSLDRKQVALASYTGFYTPQILSQLPDHGLWYWDVFDMHTHKKRLSVRGLFMDLLVSDAQGNAAWLPDSRLVLRPGSEREQQFLLCDLSDPVRKAEE